MGKYVQIKDANWRIPYIGGWCEGYVEGAWGRATKPTPSNQTTSGVHASAMAAWNAEKNKHTDMPPAGITVPVYFSLGSTSYGHVAIRLDDLMVASSTQAGYHPQGYIHPNINDLIALFGKYNNGCKYLGWGEHVGGIRVVEYQPDITVKNETTTTKIAFSKKTVNDPDLAEGKTKLVIAGVDGSSTTVTQITYSDGNETGRKVISNTIQPPVDEVTAIGIYVEPKPEVPPVLPKKDEHVIAWLTRLITWVKLMLERFTFK